MHPHAPERRKGLHCLMSRSETDEGVAKDSIFARIGNQTREPCTEGQYAIH